MAGISSKALAFGQPENKKKYNGIEFENSFDVNIGEAFFRTHDPQLGRWWQIDPKPFPEVSLYTAMNNNPIALSDFLGDTTNYYNKETGALISTVYGGEGLNDRLTSEDDYKFVNNTLDEQMQGAISTLSNNPSYKKDPKALKKQIEQIKQIYGNLKETLLNNDVLTTKIDLNSDLGHMIRATYAEMRGGDDNAKAIVAESIKNRSDLPDGTFEKGDGTYSGIVNKFYDVSKSHNSSNGVYNNPYKEVRKNSTELAAWTSSVSASIRADKGLSNVGQGVIFYHSTSSTYRDKTAEKISLNITVNGIKGLWKLKSN